MYLADVENKNAFATRDKQGQSIAVAANIISFAVPCIGGYLAGTVAGTGTQMAMYGAYTRPQEAEADALGLRWMYDAGYDPRGMKRVFEKLAEGSEVSTVSFLSTQPANEDRQQAVDALIAAQPSAGSRAARRETTVPITQAIGNPGWVPPSIKSCADATSETVIRAGCGIALYQVARFCK